MEPMTLSHADRLFVLFQDPELYQFIPRDPPASLEKFLENIKFLEGRLSRDGSENWLNWICVDKASNEITGKIEMSIHKENRSGYLAYYTFQKFWGKGYAKEACRQVIEHVFNEWNTDKIVIEIDTRNTASVRLVESLRASKVGFKAKADFFKGRNSDEYLYELRRPQ